MSSLILTGHAAIRMAQRSIKFKDAQLIALIGTEVEDGYLVRVKDYRGATVEATSSLTDRSRN
jgi:hypothetical protein